MKNLVYIIFFFTCISQAQIVDRYTRFAGCTADPNEHHTSSNAASDPNCNEANATTGWTAVTGGQGTMSANTSSHTGTYAMKIERTSAGASSVRMEYSFSVTSGDTFTITWQAKKDNSGGNVYATAWQNLSGGPSFDGPGNSYAGESYNVTATSTGTATLRFYADSSGSGNVGDDYYVDNLSIIKTN